MAIRTLIQIEAHNNQVIELLQVGEEYRIDSRAVAPGIGIKHQTFLETLQKYQEELDHFGFFRFETEKTTEDEQGRGRPSTYVLLNRNQVLFAITLSRNTEQVVKWKLALIDALDQLDKQQRANHLLISPISNRENSEEWQAFLQAWRERLGGDVWVTSAQLLKQLPDVLPEYILRSSHSTLLLGKALTRHPAIRKGHRNRLNKSLWCVRGEETNEM